MSEDVLITGADHFNRGTKWNGPSFKHSLPRDAHDAEHMVSALNVNMSALEHANFPGAL